MNKKMISISALGLVTAVVLFFFHNCGPTKFQNQSFPEIGKVVKLETANIKAAAKADGQYGNVLIQFFAGGRTIFYDENATIRMYADNEATELLYEFTPRQLEKIHEDSDCDESIWHYLENAYLGDALFCKGSLELEKIRLYVYSRPGKSDRSATSYTFEYANEEDDLLAITVGF